MSNLILGKLNYFVVLDDNQTYSGLDYTSIQVFQQASDLAVDDMDSFDNGILPDHNLVEVSIKRLLKEALAADLPSVQELKRLIHA